MIDEYFTDILEPYDDFGFGQMPDTPSGAALPSVRQGWEYFQSCHGDAARAVGSPLPPQR